MLVFPAIDIRGGLCVRLQRGDYGRETVYDSDPVAVASRFIDAGATHVHVVDLDGARTGSGQNLQAIGRIAGLGIQVQTGGGIRTASDIERRMSAGVFRCVMGTAAVENPDLVAWAVQQYGSAIAVGIDAKDGMVAVRGWEKKSTQTPVALGNKMKAMGVDTAVFTQISRDGMRTGPDIQSSRALADQTGLSVIVSGGVGNIGDIEAVYEAGLCGVIVGKALYEENVTIEQMLQYHNGQ